MILERWSLVGQGLCFVCTIFFFLKFVSEILRFKNLHIIKFLMKYFILIIQSYHYYLIL